MPLIGHLFYGFCLLIPLMYYSKNKFSYKIAFIFLMNQIYGPDMVALFFITPFHCIIGFLILAIPYSLIFSYGSRFSLVKSANGFPLKLVDDGKREINWKNAYCVTAAGGFSHFFIDQFFHRELEMNLFDSLWFNIKLPHVDIMEWSGDLYHYYTPLRLASEFLIVISIILALYFFMKGWKETSKLFLIFSGLSLALMIINPLFFQGERELSVFFEIAIYILLPLFLLLYAARDVEDHPIETPRESNMEPQKRLNIMAIVCITFAIFLTIYSIAAVVMSEFIAELLMDSPTSEIITSVTIFGYFYGTIAVLLLIGSVGFLFKNNLCRYIVIATSLYLIIFGFPIAITFFLCDKDIKALFIRES